MGNLQKELDDIIQKGGTKSLLLHSCCAPCSSYVLEYLAQHFSVTLFYYNPNILPQSEHDLRFDELARLVNKINLGNIKIIKGDYPANEFLDAVKGLESEPEGGRRCEVCFNLRLAATAQMAKKLGSDFFTTSLSISPHKSSLLLDNVAVRLAEEYGVSRLPSDFKKKGGYQRSIALSKEYDLYRQDWCGCPFSKIESERRRNG